MSTPFNYSALLIHKTQRAVTKGRQALPGSMDTSSLSDMCCPS